MLPVVALGVSVVVGGGRVVLALKVAAFAVVPTRVPIVAEVKLAIAE